MVVTATVLATLLKDPLFKALGWTYAGALKSYRNRKMEKSLENLSEKITSVIKVKTFYQLYENIDLHEFYVPIRVNDVSLAIDCVSKIDSNSIVLEGKVGQGKSIFMRYLTYQEALQGEKIPLFFELRRLENSQSLEEAITSTISNWIPLFSKENFEKVAKSGHLTLFLDGFDELPHERIQKIVNEIEGWCDRYPKMQLIISTRPESEIQKSIYFKTYKLSSYTFPEQEKLIEKLILNEETQDVLKKAIKDSSIEIRNLLETPLMVTLFVMQYKATLAIPENQSEFYENLFYSLIVRHDNTKAGFKRHLNSGLSISKLQEIFEEFCFITCNNDKPIFSYSEVIAFINECLKRQKVEVGAEKILEDFSKVIFLLIKDDLKYSFTHKSVQEYFYASFVCKKRKEHKKDFYLKLLQISQLGVYAHMSNISNLLEEIDTYSYYEYFKIPALSEYIDCYEITFQSNCIVKNLYIQHVKTMGSFFNLFNRGKITTLLFLTPPQLRSLLDFISFIADENAKPGHGFCLTSSEPPYENHQSLENFFDEKSLKLIYQTSIAIGREILKTRQELNDYISKADERNFDL